MDSIMAFLKNQEWALLAALIVPWLYKYIPGLRNLSNQACALVAALSAWMTNVFAPTPAEAAFLGGALGTVGSIFVPALDALITKALHDWILNPAYKAFGLRAPQPDLKPVK